METPDDDWLLEVTPADIRQLAKSLKPNERDEYDYTFSTTAHEGQLPPPGEWRTWLIMAGRGFGKTRAGAEWVRAIADTDPQARIALVGATLGEARSVMVEGESGLLACCAPHNRPQFEPSLRRVTFANGALALLYGANEPESLRGPQHSHARRAIAEGILRQRSARFNRRAAAGLVRGRGGGPAVCPKRWRGMACCERRDRRLGGARRQACLVAIGQLAVRGTQRRHAGVRPIDRADAALSRRMAAPGGAGRPDRRSGHRR